MASSHMRVEHASKMFSFWKKERQTGAQYERHYLNGTWVTRWRRYTCHSLCIFLFFFFHNQKEFRGKSNKKTCCVFLWVGGGRRELIHNFQEKGHITRGGTIEHLDRRKVRQEWKEKWKPAIELFVFSIGACSCCVDKLKSTGHA